MKTPSVNTDNVIDSRAEAMAVDDRRVSVDQAEEQAYFIARTAKKAVDILAWLQTQ